MTLSIIIPVFNEEENVRSIYERLIFISGEIAPHRAEFVFINDGSKDNSLSLLKEIAAKDQRVKIISFTSNFGSHVALFAGFEHCRTDAAVNLSCDSQEPAELIIAMFKKWLEGEKLILGYRLTRDDPYLRKIFSRIYVILMRRYALKNFPSQSFDICLLDRAVIDKLVSIDEKNTSIFNLILWLGFSYVSISYDRQKRLYGKSKWSFARLFKLFIDSFIPFSYFPIRLVSGVGVFVSLVGFLYAGFIFYNRFFSGGLITGWSSLIIVILLISGFQLIMLGLVSEYLWRTYDAAKNRPRYVIAERTGF